MEVTEEGGLYTYAVVNELFSSLVSNYFAVDTVYELDVIAEGGAPVPTGWAGGFYPFEDDGRPSFEQQIAYLASDGLTCVPTPNVLAQGDQLTFTVESRYGPGDQRYTLGFFDADCIDLIPKVNGPIIGPTVAPIPAPLCDFDGDGDCDLMDEDSLVANIVAGENTAGFDLNNDNLLNASDLDA